MCARRLAEVKPDDGNRRHQIHGCCKYVGDVGPHLGVAQAAAKAVVRHQPCVQVAQGTNEENDVGRSCKSRMRKTRRANHPQQSEQSNEQRISVAMVLAPTFREDDSTNHGLSCLQMRGNGSVWGRAGSSDRTCITAQHSLQRAVNLKTYLPDVHRSTDNESKGSDSICHICGSADESRSQRVSLPAEPINEGINEIRPASKYKPAKKTARRFIVRDLTSHQGAATIHARSMSLS